jgi:peptidoglycan/xylan/chitin deacetylase (PgdA/CDA1 family)
VKTSTPRRIAVVPAYNEEPTVAAVLDVLYPLVDELVVVDDGSVDNTRAEIERWMNGRDRVHLLVHEVNQGMSEAYYTALTELRERLRTGELDADDLVFTVDADGQHDLDVLDELVEMTKDERLDANLARRDLSYHGPFKRTGNWVVSRWASLWAGSPLFDVESGYRIFRLGALAHALDYYSGYKYSETVEVAVVMCQLGYRVRNDHLVPVPVARSRTRMRDAVIDLAVIPVAATRVWRRDRAREAFPVDAVAHVALASIIAVLCAFTYVASTDTLSTLVLGAIAAFGAGGVVRRYLPRGALALLGPVLAAVAVWLIPQRPDFDSAIVLAALFGIATAIAAPAVRRPRPWVLGSAFLVIVALRLESTRAVLLAAAFAAVVVAALTARFGHIGIPRTRRLRTLSVGSALVVTTTGLIGYFGATTASATWFGGGVRHGPRTTNEVAITFDDGPDAGTTPEIMRILDENGVKATFFVVGKQLEAEPQIVRALYDDGNLVANHSYHLDDWRFLDPSYPELERTQQAFARTVGTCPVWFRPPHGQHTPFMANVVRKHNMRMAMWDVSAGDNRETDPQELAARVLAKVRGGSIIDLHDGIDGKPSVDRSVVVKALPIILAGLHDRGLDPVRLDELMGGNAYQTCAKSKS